MGRDNWFCFDDDSRRSTRVMYSYIFIFIPIIRYVIHKTICYKFLQ